MPFFLTQHFWAYYFTGYQVHHAYEAAVWGNVIAIFPSAPLLLILGVLAYYFHKRAMAPLHEKIDMLAQTHADQHDEHMRAVKSILDALDPDTESESQLDVIADRVDEKTPGGLKSVLDAVAGDGHKMG